MSVFDKARKFIYMNARPIDIARFQFLFEKGSVDAVINALSYYRNDDGGFGHALEADSWNPNSSPMQTWVATRILHEIGFPDTSRPIIDGMLKYLSGGKDFDGHFWFASVKSNNDYPHAPWWQTDGDSNWNNDYNPTASLAGFAMMFSGVDSELHNTSCRIINEAYAQLMSGNRENGMHTVASYVQLLDYLKKDKLDCVSTALLESKLRELVKATITRDKSEWENSYICKPSQFFYDKKSVFYSDNIGIAEYECDFIMRTQLDDGSWPIPWNWSDYQEQWSISKNWWKSNMIISNLLYLKGFDRI